MKTDKLAMLKIMIPRLVLAILLNLILLSSTVLISQAGTWKGMEVEIDGVKHMKSPSQGMKTPREVRPKELWRIGGNSDNEDEFFGLIKRVTVDEQGNLYLLDYQLKQIKVFSPDGKFIRAIGREGEGPGEFSSPLSIVITPEGNIGVLNPRPLRLIQFDSEGRPLEIVPLHNEEDGELIGYTAARQTKDHMVVRGSITKELKNTAKYSSAMKQRNYLASLSFTGQELTIYHQWYRQFDFAHYVASEIVQDNCISDNFNNRWDVNSSGNIAFTPDHQNYIVHVKAADGTMLHVIEKEYVHRARTDEQFELMEKIYRFMHRYIPNTKIVINEYHKDIMSLYYRNNGQIWVLSSDGVYDQADDVMGVFDLFDDKGRFLREITLKGDGDPKTDLFFFFGERLYVVTELANITLANMGLSDETDPDEEPEPMSVICYEMKY